jgi:hypothetical protein
MLDCDSNFTETKDFVLTIVVERDANTFTIILLKICEHRSLSGHMIGASAIYHSTYSIGGVSLQNKLGFCFRYQFDCVISSY